MTSASATQHSYPYENQSIWSRSEKAVAHKAFEAALNRELQEVMKEAKQLANQINEPADLWNFETYLSQRRKQIDRKYDYRYSQLTDVFGRLMYEGRLKEEELRGLREDKLKAIRFFAKFLSEMAA